MNILLMGFTHALFQLFFIYYAANGATFLSFRTLCVDTGLDVSVKQIVLGMLEYKVQLVKKCCCEVQLLTITFVQIISQESIVELGKTRDRSQQSDHMRALALSVFSQCRRMLIHTANVKSLTGFGTAASTDVFLKSKDVSIPIIGSQLNKNIFFFRKRIEYHTNYIRHLTSQLPSKKKQNLWSRLANPLRIKVAYCILAIAFLRTRAGCWLLRPMNGAKFSKQSRSTQIFLTEVGGKRLQLGDQVCIN